MANPFLFSKFMQASSRFSPVTILTLLFHLPNLVRLYIRLLNDPRVPFHLKLLCWGAIAYFFLPWELIPDFPALFIGRIDDFAFLFLAFRKLVKDSPPEVVQEHVRDLSGLNKNGTPEDYAN